MTGGGQTAPEIAGRCRSRRDPSFHSHLRGFATVGRGRMTVVEKGNGSRWERNRNGYSESRCWLTSF